MHESTDSRDRPAHYQVQVAGTISERWVTWFEELAISTQPSPYRAAVTILTGRLADQAALLGLLQKLDTLGYLLLSVRRAEPGEWDDEEREEQPRS